MQDANRIHEELKVQSGRVVDSAVRLGYTEAMMIAKEAHSKGLDPILAMMVYYEKELEKKGASNEN